MTRRPPQLRRRSAWLFDRYDRLTTLAARAREQAHALYRERCDVPRVDSARRAALASRIAIFENRFRVFAACARVARRAHRHGADGERG